MFSICLNFEQHQQHLLLNLTKKRSFIWIEILKCRKDQRLFFKAPQICGIKTEFLLTLLYPRSKVNLCMSQLDRDLDLSAQFNCCCGSLWGSVQRASDAVKAPTGRAHTNTHTRQHIYTHCSICKETCCDRRDQGGRRAESNIMDIWAWGDQCRE